MSHSLLQRGTDVPSHPAAHGRRLTLPGRSGLRKAASLLARSEQNFLFQGKTQKNTVVLWARTAKPWWVFLSAKDKAVLAHLTSTHSSPSSPTRTRFGDGPAASPSCAHQQRPHMLTLEERAISQQRMDRGLVGISPNKTALFHALNKP